MFTSKGLFSEILCPYNETCMLPRCIFKHADQKPTPVTPSLQIRDDLVSGHEQEGKRKRIKLGEEAETSTTSEPKKEHAPPSKTQSDPRTSQLAGKKISLAATRTISPPPLRRNIANGTSAAVKQTPTQTSKNTTPPKAKPAPKTPVKAEDLNPRHLDKAPAKHDIRFRLLRALHEHFVRLNTELAKDASATEEELVLTEQELITKALDMEQQAAASFAIYSNLIKNKILQYKKMTVKQWVEERVKDVAAEKAKSNPAGAAATPTGPPKVIETGLTPEQNLSLLPRLYTPISGLSAHGYVTKIPSEKEIEQAKAGVEAAKGWELCDRCKSRFQVFPGRREEDGALTSGGKCVHHFGKPYFEEKNPLDPRAKRQKRYRCCNEVVGETSGCTVVENHVFKISEVKRMASVLNFAETPQNLGKEGGSPVCIDGEMGYTVYGLELIRLTATSWPNGEELFDVLVRPVGPILDLNSRYSGVWPEDFAKAPAWTDTSSAPPQPSASTEKRQLPIVDSPAAARSLLFSFLAPTTPLIGHGLENDLNAIRLIHPTLIDTALLFPHKAGLPFRNGLKALMAQHLNRHIQAQKLDSDGNTEGHDSKEDANAAGELVGFKLAEYWKGMERVGWRFEPGGILSKGGKEVKETKADKLKALARGGTGELGKKRTRDEIEEEERRQSSGGLQY